MLLVQIRKESLSKEMTFNQSRRHSFFFFFFNSPTDNKLISISSWSRELARTSDSKIILTSERTTLSHSLWRRSNIRTPAFFISYSSWLIDMQIVPKIDVFYYPLLPLASARDNTKLFALFKLVFRLQILLRT